MTIAPGTLCLLVNGHKRAGRQCTVLAYFTGPIVCEHATDGEVRVMTNVYSIDIHGEVVPPGAVWIAMRRHLFPLNDPDLPVDVDTGTDLPKHTEPIPA